MASLRPLILELIRNTSTGLPEDVLDALADAREKEPEGSRAWSTFELMIQNVEEARKASAPICQDTGTLIFYVDYGPDHTAHQLEKDIVAAVRTATKKSWLRPNAVDPITGVNSGDNVGTGSPYIHFHARKEKGARVRLMMKGGGCENMGAQYSLPDESIGAGRDLDGIRRCIIDAVQRAQGYGCAPGTVGVGVGGDRVTSAIESKEQLFRALRDTNPNPTLAALEEELTESLQGLNIGPMGFGGKTTVLGVKIGTRHRVPASFFVSIAYMCWAYRKGDLQVKGNKATLDGHALPVAVPAPKVARPATAAKAGRKVVGAASAKPAAKKVGGKTAKPAARTTASKTVKVAARVTAGKTVKPAVAKKAPAKLAKAAKPAVAKKAPAKLAKAAKPAVAKKAPAKVGKAAKPIAAKKAPARVVKAAKPVARKPKGPAIDVPSRRASRKKLPVI